MRTFSILKNETFKSFVYKAWDKILKKEIPMFCSIVLKDKRYSPKNILETYDGSGQCVHPDVIQYKNELLMTFTPYPYGIDTYENPSIVFYKNKNWFSYRNANPLIKESDYNWHLSDPCFCIDKEELILLYRRTEKRNSKNSSLFITKMLDREGWTVPQKLSLKSGRDYISPAIVYDHQFHLFFVDLHESENEIIVLSGMQYDKLSHEERVSLKGFKNETVWHFGLAAEEDWNSKISKNSHFDSLITTVDKCGIYKLYYGKLYFSQKWILEKSYPILQTLSLTNKIIYKSAFAVIDNEKTILVSLKDKKNIWKISQFPAESFL